MKGRSSLFFVVLEFHEGARRWETCDSVFEAFVEAHLQMLLELLEGVHLVAVRTELLILVSRLTGFMQQPRDVFDVDVVGFLAGFKPQQVNHVVSVLWVTVLFLHHVALLIDVVHGDRQLVCVFEVFDVFEACGV